MRWKDFEDLVTDIQGQFMPGWTVKPSTFEVDKSGARRQLDAVLEYAQGAYSLRMLVEATTLSDPIDVTYVDAVATKYRRLDCQKAVIVCRSGYTKGALSAAAHEGVETWILRPVRDSDLDGTIGTIKVKAQVTVPQTRDFTLRTQPQTGKTVSVTFSQASRDQFNVYDQQGLPRGNLWDWFVKRCNKPGAHEFTLIEGDHLYLSGARAPLEVCSFHVDEISTGTREFEIDLDATIAAVYEDAQTGKIRMVRRRRHMNTSDSTT